MRPLLRRTHGCASAVLRPTLAARTPRTLRTLVASVLVGSLAGSLAPVAAASARHHSAGTGHVALHADGDTLAWQPTHGSSHYLLSAVTRSAGRQHIVQSTVDVVSGTHTHVSGPAGDAVTYRVRARQAGSPWTNPVTIQFPGTGTGTGTGTPSQAPTIALSGDTISWSAGSSALGAVSTAPRGASNRQTSYVPVPTSGSWAPTPVPGQTLYYGVEVDGQWSANEVEISWPAGSSSGSTGTTGTTGTGTTGTGSTGSAGGAPTGTAGGGTTGSTGTTGTGAGGVSGLGSSMLVGLDEQGWGQSAAADVAGSFKIDRMDVAYGEDASDFWTRGTAVDMLFSGDYNQGGVSSINATSFAANEVQTFQSECDGSAVNCPSIEVLNEPYGSWFWGPNAQSSANEAAYANLLVTTYTDFHNQYGAASPKILAAYGSDSWWQGLQAAVPNIDDYVDGVSVHAYGGVASVASSALGDRELVTDAYQTTGKPVWVTEFGWPTAVGQPATGDSLQWSQNAQASNTYNFVNWLRSTGYVAAALDFNYRDYGTNDWYGLETTSGTKKPAWTALAEAADQQPCTVCSST